MLGVRKAGPLRILEQKSQTYIKNFKTLGTKIKIFEVNTHNKTKFAKICKKTHQNPKGARFTNPYHIAKYDRPSPSAS